MFSTLSTQAAAGSKKTVPQPHLLQAVYTQLSISLHSVQPSWSPPVCQCLSCTGTQDMGPGKLLSYTGGKLHHLTYNNKEDPGDECDFEVLMREQGVRRDGK